MTTPLGWRNILLVTLECGLLACAPRVPNADPCARVTQGTSERPPFQPAGPEDLEQLYGILDATRPLRVEERITDYDIAKRRVDSIFGVRSQGVLLSVVTDTVSPPDDLRRYARSYA